MNTDVDVYLAAANELADARVRYAQEFQRAKATQPGITDGHAHQIAIETTNDDVARLEAQVFIRKTLADREMHS